MPTTPSASSLTLAAWLVTRSFLRPPLLPDLCHSPGSLPQYHLVSGNRNPGTQSEITSLCSPADPQQVLSRLFCNTCHYSKAWPTSHSTATMAPMRFFKVSIPKGYCASAQCLISLSPSLSCLWAWALPCPFLETQQNPYYPLQTLLMLGRASLWQGGC